MYPTTPSAADLTRPRLHQVAAWIRDELDPIVAREGPEILRADDVLTLHEIFRSLRGLQTITALDLRATGIHRAVMEVAGTATRWPGRLADDCDRIVQVWRMKFGPLEDLRPFLYGRAGRLEGIASATEFSKASLLQRWQRICPDKVAPKRSHIVGDLGFEAGAWWLNPLFAHHAGIIDLDTTEGGVCYDKHGAYAVLMKDTGEIEASSENYITYRCSQDDKGRFRLTSAVPRSRAPIRILRSHSLNSIWGPRAGVRYEGLYRVKGWAIRPVKNKDLGRVERKVGDIMYEVEFERDDPVSMEEVMRHPTTFELDDYAEYKRLRRVHREGPQKSIAGILEPDVPTKAAPPISQARALSMTKRSSSPSRSTTFNHLLATIHGSPRPSRTPSARSVAIPEVESYFGSPKNMLEVPTAASMRTGTTSHLTGPRDKNDSPKSERSFKSYTSSIHTQNSNIDEIREVAPWIDSELMLAAPTKSTPGIPETRESIQQESIRIPSPKASTLNTRIISRDPSPCSRYSRAAGSTGGRRSPIPSLASTDRKKSRMGWEPSLIRAPTRDKAKNETNKDPRKSIMGPLVRNKNPLAKLFDGTDGTEEADYFSFKDISYRSASLPHAKPESTVPRRLRSSSSHATISPLSPVPMRPLSPLSPFIVHRRDAICLPYGFGYVVTENPLEPEESISDDPFVDEPEFPVSTPARISTKSLRALPVSLKDFISKPTVATPVSVSPELAASVSVSPVFEKLLGEGSGEVGVRGGGLEGMDSAAGRQLRSMFKDLFKEAREKDKQKEREGSEGVESLAPDACP